MNYNALRVACENAIADAEVNCGGDGKGCAAFRPYYESDRRRWAKCGQCPMDVLADIIECLSKK